MLKTIAITLACLATACAASPTAPMVDEATRYELRLTVGEDDYIVDHNLSRAECMDMVHMADEWTDGAALYRCERETVKGNIA